MKRQQTKFQVHTKKESQVIRSKKSKFIVGSNVSSNSLYLFTNILLKLQQQILICFCTF